VDNPGRGIAAAATGYGSGMVEGPVPDSAMDTKSEAGEPGSSDTTPLTDEERAILHRLRDGGGGPEEPAAEDSPAYGAAADDDTPVPGQPPAGPPDPLDPVFREPNP
jgi:hypothetical protein